MTISNLRVEQQQRGRVDLVGQAPDGTEHPVTLTGDAAAFVMEMLDAGEDLTLELPSDDPDADE